MKAGYITQVLCCKMSIKTFVSLKLFNLLPQFHYLIVPSMSCGFRFTVVRFGGKRSQHHVNPGCAGVWDQNYAVYCCSYLAQKLEMMNW